MTARARRWAPMLAAALLSGCVSLEEEALPKGSIAPDQRTLVLVFASPGPVYTEDDNKAETAAKIIPGLGLVVKSVQDDSATRRSKELAQYLPRWDPAAEFLPFLQKELRNSGHPGRFIALSDAPELTLEKLTLYNRADDVLDWQLRYYIDNPDHPVPRNYSTLLSLDDALIFEVNLRWGIAAGDEDKATPAISAETKLIRADTSHVLWRHEDAVSDDPGARTTYEFKLQPDDLMAKYRKLLAPLAQAVAVSYRKNLQAAGLFRNPTNGVTPGAGPSAMPYGMTPSATPTLTPTTASTGTWVSPAVAYLNAHPVVISTTTPSSAMTVVAVSTPAVSASSEPAHP